MGKGRKVAKQAESCDEEPSTSVKKCSAEETRGSFRSGAKDECTIWVLKADVSGNADVPSSEDVTFQQTLFSQLETACLAPQWIEEEACLNVSRKGNEIFVLPSFSGKVFEHLCKAHCRIYGSLAALSCLNASERLPKWTHPIQSVTLKDAVICFTGLDYSTREAQTALILRMCGVVSKDFNDEVTHLVALEHNMSSKKYLAAAQRGIPVMSLEWLEKASEEASKFSEVRFTDSNIIEIYRLKLFSGCLMTCSGVSLQERLLLGQLIEQNGGKFKGDMERYKCTHLLTDLNSGEKYRKAREWGWDTIKIVRVAWLAKCIEKGYRIEERLYEPKVPVKYSTPKDSMLASPANLEFSAISGSKHHLSDALERSGATFTPVLSGLKCESRTGGNTLVVEQTRLGSNRTLNKSSSSRIVNEPAQVDPIKEFEITHLGPDDFLEGCRLFICGVSKPCLGKWKRLINQLGASVSSILNDTITHVIVGKSPVDPKLHSELEALSKSCTIVKCDWLIECAKARKMVAASEFTFCFCEKDETACTQDGTTGIAALDGNNAEVLSDKTILLDLMTVDAVGDNIDRPSASKGSVGLQSSVALVEDVSTKNTPLNKRLEALRTASQRSSRSVGSPLIDSPSAFLDPNKKFVPRFDLRQAYEYVDAMQSFEQPSHASEDSSWSESAVGRLLEQAITKTSRKSDENLQQNAPLQELGDRVITRTASVSERNLLDCDKLCQDNLRSKSFESLRRVKSNKNGSERDDDEKPPVSNEEKMRMIEHRLANLAHYGGSSRFIQSGKTTKSRKRHHSKSNGDDTENPAGKRGMCEASSKSAPVCDSVETMATLGNVGWEEANQSSVKKTAPGSTHPDITTDTTANISSIPNIPEKIIPIKFNLDDEVIFVEKQNSSGPGLSVGKRHPLKEPDENMGGIGKQSRILDERELLKPVGAAGRTIQYSSESVAEQFHPLLARKKRSLECASEETDSSDASYVNLRPARKQKMTFILSSLEDVKRQKYASIISSLGGELSAEFNEDVTILVCGDIVRNEKLLTSIACGLFVLKPEFIEESEKAGKWVEPDEFEWGSPNCIARHEFPNKRIEVLAMACRRWRIKVNETSPKRKAFFGWNVLLYCGRRRSIDIGRIISFGGGVSVLRDDVELIGGFTHALVERSKYWNDKELDTLAKMRLNCYSMDYIANYLTVDEIVEKDYFHPDYARRLPDYYLNY